jgi:hypothetical protein
LFLTLFPRRRSSSRVRPFCISHFTSALAVVSSTSRLRDTSPIFNANNTVYTNSLLATLNARQMISNAGGSVVSSMTYSVKDSANTTSLSAHVRQNIPFVLLLKNQINCYYSATDWYMDKDWYHERVCRGAIAGLSCKTCWDRTMFVWSRHGHVTTFLSFISLSYPLSYAWLSLIRVHILYIIYHLHSTYCTVVYPRNLGTQQQSVLSSLSLPVWSRIWFLQNRGRCPLSHGLLF